MEAENPASTARPLQVMPRAGSLTLRQPFFDWRMPDKCQDLWNFKIEVRNILLPIAIMPRKMIKFQLCCTGREERDYRFYKH